MPNKAKVKTMKMQEALNIMEAEAKPVGFMVHFIWNDKPPRSDYFPDVRNGEPPIATENEAWQMAEKFAAKTRGICIHVYVVRSVDCVPVHDFLERMIENR